MKNPDFIIKRFEVTVAGYGYSPVSPVYTSTRGKALAEVWRSDAFNHLPFGAFLKIAKARRNYRNPENFGDPIIVCGKAGFYVGCDGHYVQFVRPGSDVILHAHLLDVEPPEYRKYTAYRQDSVA